MQSWPISAAYLVLIESAYFLMPHKTDRPIHCVCAGDADAGYALRNEAAFNLLTLYPTKICTRFSSVESSTIDLKL